MHTPSQVTTTELFPIGKDLWNTVYTFQNGYPAYHVCTTSILSPSTPSSSRFALRSKLARSAPLLRLTRQTTTITRVDYLDVKKAVRGEVVATIRWNACSFRPVTVKIRDGVEMKMRDYMPISSVLLSV